MDHKKYHLIQSKIEEARNALRVWNDRRSEAMIELDALFMETEEFKKQMSEEKAANEKVIADLKAALEKSETDYHKHFEIYTNDMQELKVANDDLNRQLTDSNATGENLRREMKKQDSDAQARLAKTVSDFEKKITEIQLQSKNQIASLNGELQNEKIEKNSLQQKIQQYEKELRGIRAQMMSFLNVTQSVSFGGETAVASVASTDEAPSVLSQSTPPTNVEEYLKRFGY